MGTMLMDSAPPARITSAWPTMMRSEAIAMAWRPEEQKRLMVIAEDSMGRPARRAAMRATFMPCSASGMAQPRMTSSISCGSKPGTRAIAPWMATAARSSGRVERSVPLNALPTAVRTELTRTASRMRKTSSGLDAKHYWTTHRKKKQERLKHRAPREHRDGMRKDIGAEGEGHRPFEARGELKHMRCAQCKPVLPLAGDEDGGGRPDAVGSREIALVESEAHLTAGVHIEEGPANGDVHKGLDVGRGEGLVVEAKGEGVTESVTELAKFVAGDIGDQRAVGIVEGDDFAGDSAGARGGNARLKADQLGNDRAGLRPVPSSSEMRRRRRKNVAAVEGGGNRRREHPGSVGDFAGGVEAVAIEDRGDESVVGENEELALFRLDDDGLARGADAGVNHREKYCAGGIVRRNAAKKTRAFFDGKRRDLVGDVHDARAGGDADDDRFADGHGIVGGPEVGHEDDGGRSCGRILSGLMGTAGKNGRDGDCGERKDAAHPRACAAEENRAAPVQHTSSQFGGERHFFSGAHAKLAASLVSPEPLYLAICGYGHRGRVNLTPCAGSRSFTNFVAMILSGAIPFSTHCSRARRRLRCGSGGPAPNWPKEFGPGPPPQCCIPGTI